MLDIIDDCLYEDGDVGDPPDDIDRLYFQRIRENQIPEPADPRAVLLADILTSTKGANANWFPANFEDLYYEISEFLPSATTAAG